MEQAQRISINTGSQAQPWAAVKRVANATTAASALPVPDLSNGWTWHFTRKGVELHHDQLMRTLAPAKGAEEFDAKAFVRGDKAKIRRAPVLKKGSE